jgi:small subunit ribosomal protein S4
MMRKISEFGRRLREKQKLRWFYGVSEKAIRRYFKEASRQKGITGHNLLVLFETRFDNILYRSNIARSRKEARQMIRHGHFAVNNKKMDIPSFIAKEGDVININPKSLEWIKDRFSAVKEKGLPSWIGFDESKSLVTVLQRPQRTEIDVPVEEQLIIEYYSR